VAERASEPTLAQAARNHDIVPKNRAAKSS
jgi:hypothetical protein